MPTEKEAPETHPAHATSYRMCIDRVVLEEYSPSRAIAEIVAVQRAMQSAKLPASRALDPSAVETPRRAIVNLKKWPNGHTLRCRFLDRGATQKKKVQAKVHFWEEYANIKLEFVASGDAEVRISLAADPGLWSAVGTDALIQRYFPQVQADDELRLAAGRHRHAQYEDVAVHEFGHALGLIHEHQSPEATL